MQALEVAREHYRPIEWPQLQLQTNWKISFLVFAAHLLALWLIAFGAHMTAPKKMPKKLIVHTVTLQSSPATYTPKVASAPKPAAAEKKVEKVAPPQAVEPAVEKSAETEKPVELPKVMVEEEVAPAPTPQEPPKAKPVPKQASKAPVKPKAPAPAKAEKKPSKPAGKPTTKPTPAKPKPEAKKKEAPKTKSSDLSKQETIKKEQAAKAAKEKAAQERMAKEKAAKAQAAKQQAMLDKALSSLDSSGAIGGKKSTLAASAAKGGVAGPSAISSLSAESLVAIDASETANCTPAERTYYDELVSRLKLALKLPEFGEVKLQLTISRAGKVVTVKSVKSKSTKNSDYIQKALPKLHLPPFGQNFTGEKEHTFRLTLSNELNY